MIDEATNYYRTEKTIGFVCNNFRNQAGSDLKLSVTIMPLLLGYVGWGRAQKNNDNVGDSYYSNTAKVGLCRQSFLLSFALFIY